MKERIVLVGDYNRNDFLYVAKLLHTEIDFYFIEFINQRFLKNKQCLEYGKVIYWKNYKDAYDLLNKIRPGKIVFYFVESYNHVALNVACRVKKVPTFHLEHGLRFPLSYYNEINKDIHVSKKFFFLKILFRLHEIIDRSGNRLFFVRTKMKSPLNEKLFLRDYYRIRSTNNIFATFRQLRSPLRIPDRYISFSPLIYNYHKELESLPNHYPVSFIGIPQFDNFFAWKHFVNAADHILFIDQPLHEQQLYGWTLERKKIFLNELVKMISILKKKVFIKTHPFNDRATYNDISLSGYVEVISGDWDNVIPAISTVLGFSSTLLLPFMAMDHTTCFTLEMHPDQEVRSSAFLVESNACHPVSNFEDLSKKLIELKSWHEKQKQFKEEFIKNYMYKFDGRASARLKEILLSEVS
jgi:hypothetical protein